MESPVILHIPHSSRIIPEEYLSDFLAAPDEELLFMTDAYTDELFKLPYSEKLVFPVSRLVCDVERFRDDAREEMAKAGMGAVYTSDHALRPMRHVSPQQRERILREFYDPHHEKLRAFVEESLAGWEECIIIDCHSFSPVPLPYEPMQSKDRPDICIGTDDFHTPSGFADRLSREFALMGYTVRMNDPYAGALVPLEYYKRDKRVISVMIEVNRTLYMDAHGNKSEGFGKLKADICNALTDTLTAHASGVCGDKIVPICGEK